MRRLPDGRHLRSESMRLMHRIESEEVFMSLAPLLDAAPAIPLHAFAAMAAFVLGLVQFAAPKGTLPHRTLGWIWVLLMVGGGRQFVLDPPDPAGRPVEPDPPAVDLHADRCCRSAVLAGAPAPRRRSSPHHDRRSSPARSWSPGCSRCCRAGSCTRSCSVLERPLKSAVSAGVLREPASGAARYSRARRRQRRRPA